MDLLLLYHGHHVLRNGERRLVPSVLGGGGTDVAEVVEQKTHMA